MTIISKKIQRHQISRQIGVIPGRAIHSPVDVMDVHHGLDLLRLKSCRSRPFDRQWLGHGSKMKLHQERFETARVIDPV